MGLGLIVVDISAIIKNKLLTIYIHNILKQKKYACSEIWTHAELPPSDLESDALDRSAIHALSTI